MTVGSIAEVSEYLRNWDNFYAMQPLLHLSGALSDTSVYPEVTISHVKFSEIYSSYCEGEKEEIILFVA